VSARVFKSVVLTCNRPGCLIKTTVIAERLTEARRTAAELEGWLFVSIPVPTGGPAVSADLCPDHVDYPVTLAEARAATVRSPADADHVLRHRP
jgi:hypothetical protein